MTSIPKTTHIIVVGAGWAGQGVCEALGEETAEHRRDVHRRARDTECGRDLAIWIRWRRKPMEVPLAKTSAAKFLRKGTVQSVDYAAKHVNLQFGVYRTTTSSLACGAVSDPSTIPGLAEHCVDLTAKKDFTDDIEKFLDGAEAGGKARRVVISITKCPYKCPPLPFEVACLIDDAAKRRGKGVRDAVSITVTSPVPWPFGGPKAKEAFTEAMSAKNITYLPETAVVSVDEQDGRKLVKTSGRNASGAGGSRTAQCWRVYLWGWRTGWPAPRAGLREGPGQGQATGLTLHAGAPDFVKTWRTRYATVAGKEGVYCVGDACAALIPSAGVPIPKAGEFAYKAGLALGKRLAALVRGEGGRCCRRSGRRGAWPRRAAARASPWGRTSTRPSWTRRTASPRSPSSRRRRDDGQGRAWICGLFAPVCAGPGHRLRGGGAAERRGLGHRPSQYSTALPGREDACRSSKARRSRSPGNGASNKLTRCWGASRGSDQTKRSAEGDVGHGLRSTSSHQCHRG